MTPPTTTCKKLTSFLTPFLLVMLSHNGSAACVELILWKMRVSYYEADEVVSLAWDVEKKCTALSDDVVHGRSLLKLGIALNKAQQRQEALYYMDRARTVFKAVGNTSTLLVPIRSFPGCISMSIGSRTRWMPLRRHGSMPN
jgi:hypothetical protein